MPHGMQKHMLDTGAFISETIALAAPFPHLKGKGFGIGVILVIIFKQGERLRIARGGMSFPERVTDSVSFVHALKTGACILPKA